jgi:hypothetical protein
MCRCMHPAGSSCIHPDRCSCKHTSHTGSLIFEFWPYSLHCFYDAISSYLVMNFQNKHESDLKTHTRLPDMAFHFHIFCHIREEKYSHNCIVFGNSMSVS